MHVPSTIIVSTLALLGLGLAGSGCDRGGDGRSPDGLADEGALPGADPVDPPTDDDDDPLPPRVSDEPLDEEQVRFYLSRVAPVIAGRSLRYEENQRISEEGEAAIEPMIRGWVQEPGFAESIRYMVQEQLRASGEREGVDYELPGNLAAEIARDDLPWSTLLTADYCVDGDGSHIDCDTGAPYAAGVLATRAYLLSNKGRFNLTRANVMLEAFACRIYPMEHDIQPPLAKSTLIPMFQAESEDDQVVEEAAGGFGNGIGCYFCHSQFGAHAQLFVKFDADGLWRQEATGQQDPYNELGRSFDGLYTSHMLDPYAAADETSQMFGQTVANLREAGEVMSDHQIFGQCTVKNLVANAFGLHAGATDDIAQPLVERIATRVADAESDPTIGQYVVEAFTPDDVIDAVVATLGSE
ncbi:MAG: hypothetical protein K0V04_08350 [Deltaproteobacteria bacterium]|nr:hypothetical protein [Deltaproteobacteria bacterium]